MLRFLLQPTPSHNRPRTRSGHKASRGVITTPEGLILPDRVSPLLRDSLYYLASESAAPDMHAVLNNVPALVLDCNRDVLRDLDLQRQVQQTVAEYIQVMRNRREMLRTLSSMGGGMMGGGGAGWDPSRRGASSGRGTRPQPGAPTRKEQQEAIELVQGIDSDVLVVPNSSGQLQQDEGAAAQQQLQQEQQRMSAVSGNLEALHQVAASRLSQGADAAANATSGVAV